MKIEEQLDLLQEQLTQRGNQLISSDPMANRIMGKMEALREQLPVSEEEVTE